MDRWWTSPMMILSLTTILFVTTGCSGWQSSTSTGGLGASKLAQTEEMPYAPQLKLKIVRAYWAPSVDTLADYDTPGAGAGMTQMKKAQNKFLVVELQMTNYGNEPLKPHNAPMFTLEGNGKTYMDESGTLNFTNKVYFSNSVNPNGSMNGREIFDVPPGQYDLKVSLAELNGGRFQRGGTAGIWTLSQVEGQ